MFIQAFFSFHYFLFYIYTNRGHFNLKKELFVMLYHCRICTPSMCNSDTIWFRHNIYNSSQCSKSGWINFNNFPWHYWERVVYKKSLMSVIFMEWLRISGDNIDALSADICRNLRLRICVYEIVCPLALFVRYIGKWSHIICVTFPRNEERTDEKLTLPEATYVCSGIFTLVKYALLVIIL